MVLLSSLLKLSPCTHRCFQCSSASFCYLERCSRFHWYTFWAFHRKWCPTCIQRHTFSPWHRRNGSLIPHMNHKFHRWHRVYRWDRSELFYQYCRFWFRCFAFPNISILVELDFLHWYWSWISFWHSLDSRTTGFQGKTRIFHQRNEVYPMDMITPWLQRFTIDFPTMNFDLTHHQNLLRLRLFLCCHFLKKMIEDLLNSIHCWDSYCFLWFQ